jgi:hypothetical protein
MRECLLHGLAGLCTALGALSLTLGWFVVPLLWDLSWWWGLGILAVGFVCLYAVQRLDATLKG